MTKDQQTVATVLAKQITAQDLYERYERDHDRNGVTVRTWMELGELEKHAWEAVANFVYAQMHG